MSENNKQEVVRRLMDVGLKYGDAVKLREIAMTLHRWHELECGNGDDHSSWCITRGRKGANGDFKHDEGGRPYLEVYIHAEKQAHYEPIPDKETGAIKRLQAIINQYSDLTYFIQGDPRGAALYILRPKDVPVGESIDAYYSRGIAVYK